MQYLNKPVAAICLAVASAFVQAQEAIYDFNIPAQPTSQVLNALSKQTGLQPFFTEDSVKGVQSPGVKGKCSLREALGKALVGTGLSYQFTAEKAVSIKAAPQAPAEKVAQLAPINVVDTTQKTNYAVRSTSTGSKIEVPNRDIPFSVEARPIELLDDMGGPPRVDELLKTVSGVIKAGEAYGGGGNAPRWVARGFYSSYIQRNGFSAIANYNAVIGMANVEQIEVLKGPSSVLNGSLSAAAGMSSQINIITKQPNAVTSYGGGVTAGSWNYLQEQAYFNGAVNDAKTLLVRVDVANETADDVHKYLKHDTQTIAPAVTLLIGESDTIKLRTDWTKSKYSGGISYVPYGTTKYNQVPKDAYWGTPYSYRESVVTNALLEYIHKFDNGWKFTGAYSYNDSNLNYLSDSITWNQTTGVGTVKVGKGDIPQRDTAFDLRLDGHVATGSIDHYLLAGVTERWTTSNSINGYASTNTVLTTTLLGPNNSAAAVAPIWGAPSPTSAPSEYDVKAVYAQDLISFADKYKLMVGARYDDIDKGVVSGVPQKWTHVSPRAGLVYQPTDATALYGGYTESFSPSTTTDFYGKQFVPETGKQYEVGVKQTFSDRLNANVALYQLTRANVATTDPDPAHLNKCGLTGTTACSIQAGEQQVRGLEIDVNGQIGNSFRVNFAYSHIFDAKVTKSTSTALPVGGTMYGAPADAANLFGIYSFGGDLSGLEVGGGIYYTSKVEVTLPNTFQLPSVLQLDAVASYKLNKNTKLQFNLKNITDRTNYFIVGGGGSVGVSTPRAAYLSLRMDY